MRNCSVPGCRSNHHKGPYVTVFKFPQDEETRKAWLEKIPRKYLKVTRNTAVCINHFREEEIVRELRVTRPDGTKLVLPRKKMKLKTDAVPSIFPSIPKHTLNKQVPVISGDHSPIRHLGRLPIGEYMVDPIPKRGRPPSVRQSPKKKMKVKLQTTDTETFEMDAEIPLTLKKLLSSLSQRTKRTDAVSTKEICTTWEKIAGEFNSAFLITGKSASNATSEKEQGTSRSEEIPTDMSHIFGPLHQVIQILSEISNQNKKSEQFTVFAHHVAAQLEQLPLEDSLMLQSEIQNLITAKRVKLLRDQTRHT